MNLRGTWLYTEGSTRISKVYCGEYDMLCQHMMSHWRGQGTAKGLEKDKSEEARTIPRGRCPEHPCTHPRLSRRMQTRLRGESQHQH